jgi:hypothetical protein
MSNVTAIEQRPQLAVGARPSAIVPQTLDEAYRLGKAICMAGMAPKGMDTPEKCMIAIMRGMEVGLTPMMALDKIAVVNGRPTIWGDGAIGLVRGSGLCEWVRERVEGDGDARTAICEAKRRGEPEPVIRRFSVSDAKRAGLWGKQGPWQQFPDRMLQMRARAFTLRDGFADVLGGLYLREELDNGEDRREAQTPPIPPVPQIQSQPPAIEHIPPEPPIPEPPIPQGASGARRVADEARSEIAETKERITPVKLREAPIIGRLREACDAAVAAKDVDALEAAWNDIVEPHIKSNAITADLYEALSAVYQAAEDAFEK